MLVFRAVWWQAPTRAATLCTMTLVGAMLVCLAVGAPNPVPAKHHSIEERMDVEDVLSAGEGQYVVILRTQGKPLRYLPIWVGEMEAVAIRMRLDRQDPPRPLTLNLLEQVMQEAKIKIVGIAIDDFKGGVFLGKIRLKQNNRSWEMEARPSDAIGLAVGRHAPILVTREILDGAAVDPRTLAGPSPSPSPAEEPANPRATALDESL